MQNEEIFNTETKYDDKTDIEVISYIKQGDEQALTYMLNRYKELVNYKVSKFFMIGGEKDDIFQEGMIGLFKAIKNFDEEKQSSFKTFANICIERQLITAIKSSNRQKHIPLNSYLSLNTSAYENDEGGIELLNTFNSNLIEDPLEKIMKEEEYRQIQESINNTLSDFEKQVLDRYLKGESYVVIAQKLNSQVKSIDNAIQRIRKKAIKDIFNANKS